MQRKHLIAGGALALLVGGFAFVGTDRPPAGAGEETLTPVASFSHAHGMATDLKDALKLYIATHEGLYLLKDDKELFRIGETKDDLMGFVAHPTEPGVFFSSGHPARGGNIGFQTSTDGGLSWKRLSPGLQGPVDFHAMAVGAVNPDIVYGFFSGKLQRSVDGGATWEYAKGSVAPFSLSADPIRENVLYAATMDGVLVSEDRGDTWKNLSPDLEGGAASVFALHPTDPDLALVFSERLGGLGKSTDGGVTWRRVPEEFGGGTVLFLAFGGVERNVVYAVTHDNALYKSADIGETWSKIR